MIADIVIAHGGGCWECGLIGALLLFILFGIPLIIIIGGGGWLLIDWIRRPSDRTAVTADDEQPAMARDLARLDARRRAKRKP